MKTHRKIPVVCFQLLLILGLLFGTQATVKADQLDEGTPAYFARIYQKVLEFFKTLDDPPDPMSPIIFIGIIALGFAVIAIFSLLFKGESKPENQKKRDADPPLELITKSKTNKTKEIRDAEIALYDLWYDKYFWGDPSDMKAIGHKSGGIELSPIEKIFYMNFMKHEIKSVPIIGGGPCDFTWLGCQQFINAKTGEKLESQYLPEKYFILDFLIQYWFSNPTYKLAVQIAVELDGHDYHEKTKEQAKRDKEKDRILQTHGYLVARFTGSEVYKDPMEVIEKVDSMANKWVLNMKDASRKVI